MDRKIKIEDYTEETQVSDDLLIEIVNLTNNLFSRNKKMTITNLFKYILENGKIKPAMQYQPDWNASSGVAVILNKPTALSQFSQDSTHRLVSDTEKNTWNSNSHFRGKYLTLAALQAAIPTANDGDYAEVDAGAGSSVQLYVYDAQDGWIGSSAGAFTSVNGKSGPVIQLYTTDIPDNTDKRFLADAEKLYLQNRIARTISYVLARKTDTQNITSGSTAKLTFNTVSTDKLSEFVNSKFTAINAGIYLVTVKLQFDQSSLNVSTASSLNIYKNGGLYVNLDTKWSQGSSDLVLLKGAISIELAANDYVEIYITNGHQITISPSTAAGNNHLEIVRIA